VLALQHDETETRRDISILRPGGEPQPVANGPFVEGNPAFSPDGRWLAFESDQSGQLEVYVQAFPGPGRKLQVSTDGGRSAVWARSGRELFYRNGHKLMVAAVARGPEYRFDRPRLLFEHRFLEDDGSVPAYDVAPDGQRFVMIQPVQELPPPRLNVVLGWFGELRSKAASGGN
jgi:serine/threonine-protein kinase